MLALKFPAANVPIYKEKFIVSVRNNWLTVNTKDIACFMRDNLNYLHTFNGDRYMIDFNTLEEVEELLDPKYFIAPIGNVSSILKLFSK